MIVECEAGDYVGGVGNDMRDHAWTTGHGAFYLGRPA